ncbi:MAG: choice-of-anchor B family protein [Flavobacteriales bacterium]
MKFKTLLSLLFLVFSHSVFSQQSENIKILAHWDQADIPFNGSAKYNDVLGFTVNGEEFGAIGSTMGTHIFHLPQNNELKEVGYFPGAFQEFVVHRDFAFFEGYLYAVCDQGSSSLQVIDVSNLPSSAEMVLDDDSLVVTAHNVTVDEYGEKLYLSGVRGEVGVNDSIVSYPLLVFDLSVTPQNPELIYDLREIPEIEYVHDVYARRDTVFLNAANQGFFAFDFQNGSDPQILSFMDSYQDQGYNHSGWMSDDGKYYAFADETPSMRMKIVDIQDFNDMNVVSLFNSGGNPSTMAHNLRWKGDKIYVSHYYDGLQVFDAKDRGNPFRCAFFDTHLEEEINGRGAWGIDVLPSNRILISDRQTGFYVFKELDPSDDVSDLRVYPNPANGNFTINLSQYEFSTAEIKMTDASGALYLHRILDNPEDDLRYYAADFPDLAAGIYVLDVVLDEERVLQTRVMIY